MELRHLRYFRAVAEERHFGRAAERLHIAQPPLSRQIRQLESELGVTLLRRTTRRVELTPAGEAYLARVKEILAAVDAAGDEAARVSAGVSGRLVVACVGSATYTLLPALARALRQELPGVDVMFRGEMLVPAQEEALLAGEVDLALLRPPVESGALRLETLRQDRLIVLLPDGHPLARRRRLRVADLAGEDFIVHSVRSVMHGLVADVCHDAGFAPRIRHEVAETSTLVTLVAAGLGVTIVPEPVSALGVPGALHRPLVGAPTVDLAVAVRSADDSPLLARALEVVAALAG